SPQPHHQNPPEHYPGPLPERAVYGFALHLAAWFGFAAYLVWAVLPEAWLRACGFTYLPERHWAITGPMLIPLAYALYEFSVGFVAWRACRPLESVDHVTDRLCRATSSAPGGSLPIVADIDASDACWAALGCRGSKKSNNSHCNGEKQ
ncbi:hypothetical protein BOX15_Mlig033760g6, partial [Macrostomum lignano]